MPGQIQSLGISLGLLVVAWAVLAWPWLVDGQIIPWDAKNHFYPILRFVAQSFHNDQSPAWNPYHMGGYPLISDPQSMLFSPVMVGIAALFERPSVRLVDAAQLFHLLIGGVSVLLLCRSHRWHAVAGLLAALVYMFGASASARLQHTGIILSYGYMPLAFLMLKLAIDRGSVAYGALFGLAGALMAVNRDQVAYLGCLMLIGYVLHRLLTSEDPRAFAAARWRTLAVATGCGLAALAVPLLLTFELLALSNRPSIPYDMAITGSISPVNFLSFIAPNFFKSLGGFAEYWGPGGRGWHPSDWTDRAVDYLYVGTLPIFLFLAHGIVGRRLADRDVRYFVIVLAASLLYAVGRHTPVFRILFDNLPGVALYRRPGDATFIMTFAMAMCVGYLAHRLLRDGLPTMPGRRGWLLVTAAVLAAFVAGLGIANDHGQAEHAAQAMLIAGLTIAVAAVIVRQAGQPGPYRHVWVASAVLFLLFDLRLHNVGSTMNAQSPDQLAMYESGHGDAVTAVLRDHLDRAEGLDGPYRAEIVGLGGAWQNAPMVFDIQATLGYNPLRLESYQDATGASETSHESKRRFSKLMASYRSTLVNLLGIRFICTTVPVENLDPSLKPGDLKLVDRVGKVRIYENDRALPRAMIVHQAHAIDTDAVLAGGRMPDVDFTRTVLLDPLPPQWSAAAATPNRGAQAIIGDYSNTEIRVRAEMPAPGFLVLNDLYYPYWRAYVNGEETEILTANVLFRAVMLPAGSHEVVFKFEPLALGNILAALRDSR